MEPIAIVRVTGSFEGLWYRNQHDARFPLVAEHDTGYIVNMSVDGKPTYALILFEHAELLEG